MWNVWVWRKGCGPWSPRERPTRLICGRLRDGRTRTTAFTGGCTPTGTSQEKIHLNLLTCPEGAGADQRLMENTVVIRPDLQPQMPPLKTSALNSTILLLQIDARTGPARSCDICRLAPFARLRWSVRAYAGSYLLFFCLPLHDSEPWRATLLKSSQEPALFLILLHRQLLTLV